MHKKLAAVLTIAIFAISMFAIVGPVSAHFTLGDLKGTYRYHANDFDPHVPGVIGYVWPGGGQNTWDGSPSSAGINRAPGYQSPYPGQKPALLNGANQFGNAPSSSWYQLEGDAYAPFGAVLTGSTGDLIFALNATYGYTGVWDNVFIYLPPGFTLSGGAETVVTTISNDYSGIGVVKASPYDRYCPTCTVIFIAADGGQSGNNPYRASYYNHQRISFSSAGEWYYIRINGVTAPAEAGRYFFKVYLINGGFNYLGGPEGVNPSTTAAIGNGMRPSQFIPTQNWPVMLVKGEVDPAIITGTMRYAGYNQTLYSKPIMEAGKVEAVMTTRLDPYTGQQRPDLPLVNAVAYFNATAQGHYEVEGLAPGIYDLYASAAGYPRTLVQSGFTVLKGQSLHFDGYLQPGPVIHGNVFSKHQFGDEPWPLANSALCQTPVGAAGFNCNNNRNVNQYIKIELYDGPTLNHIPDPSATMVSWSPLPCVAGGQEMFYPKRDAGYCGDPRTGANVAFPWHEYVPWNNYGNGIFYQVASGVGLGTGTQSPNLPGAPSTCTGCNFQDPEGVGPPQTWFVQGGTTNPFHFEFGVKGEYGAPRDLDGQVPQVYATWVNGLTPGRYYARAWTFRYVQSALDGSTFQEYYFDVTPNEWAGDVTLPIDIRLSSWINKTVHFHNVINGITEDPIDTGAGVMSGVLVDSNNIAWSYNQTVLGCEGAASLTPTLPGQLGFFNGGFDNCPNNGQVGFVNGAYQGQVYTKGTFTDWKGAAFNYGEFRHENHLDMAGLNQRSINTGRANIQFAGFNDTWGGENYGIPSGTYQPHVFVLGYIEAAPVEWVSVTLSGNPTLISDHVYRGAGFNLTLYSIDWERPRVSRNWVWGQWGYGLTTDTAAAPGAEGLCSPFPLNNNPNAPDTYCSGQQPYPWGAGFTHGGTGTFGNGLGQVPPYPQITAACPDGPNDPRGSCRPMVGQEIDVGLYSNGTLVDLVSDEIGNMADTTPTSCLFQNDTATFVQMCGGGWSPLYLDPASQKYIPYDGNANDAFFGQELLRLGFVGGVAGGLFQVLTATKLNGNAVAHFSPSSVGLGAGKVGGMFNAFLTGYTQLYPSALPVGQQYDLRAFTYGYVQDKDYSLYAASSQVADMKINLIIGVNVTLDVLFKKEHIITPTDGNMSARVRLFDDSGNLVAEWMSSEGTYVTGNGFARAADGTTQFPFGNMGDPANAPPGGPFGEYGGNGGALPFPKPLNTYNYLPGGVTELRVLMAGIPQVPAAGQNGGIGEWYNKETYFWDPVFGGLCEFDLTCYAAPGMSWSNPGFFANTGILGAPDYQGGWTAEVDFVNWYANSTGPDCFEGIGVTATGPNGQTCPTIAPSSETYVPGGFPPVNQYTIPTGSVVINTPGVPMAAFTNVPQQTPNYFPPFNGLLMGESYHIIPGTTAKSGISLTEDTALGDSGVPYAVMHSMQVNHLGPYSQEGVWQISSAHLSGEASAIFEVDLNGLVSGNALAFTWSNEFRPLSWGHITVTGAGLPQNLDFYTWDGVYEAYLPVATGAGSTPFSFTLDAPGYASQSWTSAVSSGQTGRGQNLYLEQSNIPVPEFNGLAIVAISALAASLYVLRRRRK